MHSLTASEGVQRNLLRDLNELAKSIEDTALNSQDDYTKDTLLEWVVELGDIIYIVRNEVSPE